MPSSRGKSAVWVTLERSGRSGIFPIDKGTRHAYSEHAYIVDSPKYYDGAGPFAVCGRHVLTRLPEEFDPEHPEACPKCVAALGAGVYAYAPPPPSYWYDCGRTVTPGAPFGSAAIACVLREDHRGPHRGPHGETWEFGAEDFTPAPDGRV